MITTEVKLDKLFVSNNMARSRMDDHQLSDLMQSMRENGLIQPIVVRKANKGNFEVVAGHRRFSAATKLGWKKIDVSVVKENDEQSAIINLSENVARVNPSLNELGLAYRSLSKLGLTNKEIATRVGNLAV